MFLKIARIAREIIRPLFLNSIGWSLPESLQKALQIDLDSISTRFYIMNHLMYNEQFEIFLKTQGLEYYLLAFNKMGGYDIRDILRLEPELRPDWQKLVHKGWKMSFFKKVIQY